MFPRAERLRDKRLYEFVFKRGSWARGRNFGLVAVGNQKEGKIGFIVTKKVAKAATQRNRIKRRVRAIFMNLVRDPHFAPLFARTYLVVVLYKPSDTIPFTELTQEAASLLTKLQAKPGRG